MQQEARRYQKRMNMFLTRIFEGFLASEMSHTSRKIRLEMVRLDSTKLGSKDYCEYFLGLFRPREELFQLERAQLRGEVWDKFDSSMTTLENCILKIGFSQTSHRAEIEYLQKEIGKGLTADLKDRILGRLKRDIQAVKGEYKIDRLWESNVELENVIESENARFKKLLEICFQLVADETIVASIYENTSKTRLLGMDLNKFLKVACNGRTSSKPRRKLTSTGTC